METEFINPNNPVYISYAWRDGVDQDVLDICEVMRNNGIQYLRDKDGLCPYKANIAEIEKRIGEGDAVIVFVSKKYMTSFHTMNEWHNILDRGDIVRRVFLVVLEDAKISNYKSILPFRKQLNSQYEDLKNDRQAYENEGVILENAFSNVDINAYNNRGFVYDLDRLHAFCRNFNRGSKIEVHRANGFKEIIEPLKKYVTELAETANAKKTIVELKSEIERLKKDKTAVNDKKIQEYEAKIAELNNLLSQKDKEIEKLQKANKKLQQDNASLQSTIDQLKKDLESASTKQSKTSTCSSSSKYCNVIDLGLPTGTLWADRNIGSNSPEESGYYFAWGEIEPKTGKYTWDTYKYKDNPETLPSSHDAATQNWDSDWRMPTNEQFDELLKYCEWKWDGKGYKVIGKNGNSIYLPAAGWRYEKLEHEGQLGNYWSSSHLDSSLAWNLYFDSDYRSTFNGNRNYGFPVRAVWCRN